MCIHIYFVSTIQRFHDAKFHQCCLYALLKSSETSFFLAFFLYCFPFWLKHLFVSIPSSALLLFHVVVIPEMMIHVAYQAEQRALGRKSGDLGASILVWFYY